MKSLSIILLTLIFLARFLALAPVQVRAEEAIIRVPADYPSIQEAIVAATPGSTILVSSGTYRENLVVNKTLTLLGEDKLSTIIDGSTAGAVIHIKANMVTIKGFTIRNGAHGVYVDQSNGSIVNNNIITSNFYSGVLLNKSSSNFIYDNLILTNGFTATPTGGLVVGEGIELLSSNGNVIKSNRIIANIVHGITLDESSDNLVVNNTIEYSNWSIWLREAENNTIHHNNFISSWDHVDITCSLSNVWDDGKAGNYWDDYVGLDDGSGGRVAGDGIGDTDLPHLGVDNYPLINPYGSIPIIWENREYPITILTNSTVSAFKFIQGDKKITFDVTGTSDTVGFCNIIIPKTLLSGNPWTILLNNSDITAQTNISENETHTFIYFIYNHSIYHIQIIGTCVIPEFPSTLILVLFMLATSTAIALFETKRKRQFP